MSVPRNYECISKYNIMGTEYVKLDELNTLIRAMKQKCREGTEPGYMNKDEGQRIAASLSLNHLQAVINKEKSHEQILMRVMKTRVEREAKEQAEKPEEKPEPKPKDKPNDAPGRYTVWHNVKDQETTKDSLCFVRWEDKKPLFSNLPCKAMWFSSSGMAQHIADQLGDGWEVVDMWPVMSVEERLLYRIFSDDDEDEEE